MNIRKKSLLAASLFVLILSVSSCVSQKCNCPGVDNGIEQQEDSKLS